MRSRSMSLRTCPEITTMTVSVRDRTRRMASTTVTPGNRSNPALRSQASTTATSTEDHRSGSASAAPWSSVATTSKDSTLARASDRPDRIQRSSSTMATRTDLSTDLTSRTMLVVSATCKPDRASRYTSVVPGGEQLRPYRAMVDARAIGTLAEGLGSRFHQTLSPRGAAQTRGWRWAALGCAALDVAKAYKLTRDDHFNLPARLLLDSADLALWCAAARDDTDTSEDSVIPGVALAAEAGARLGVGGLIVPALNAAVAAAVRHRRGHRLRLEQFSWQLMGVTGGWMIRALAGRRRRTFERRHAFELHARLQEAELAGLHQVVVEHEGALDLLQRATALIDLASDSPVRRNMAGSFKSGVSQAARARATYLRDALLVWQSEHNLQPDLTRMVRFDVFPEHGTILLTEVQRSSLYAELEVLDLAGPVPVSVVDVFEARRPGGARDLLVAGQLLALPSEAKAKSWTFDAIPVAMLMEVGWLIQPTGAHREEVPWSSTAVPLAIAGAATAWATRRVDRQGRTPPWMANAAAFVTASSYTLLATRTMRHTHTEAGISRFPWVMA